jgi:hypothetical protein
VVVNDFGEIAARDSYGKPSTPGLAVYDPVKDQWEHHGAINGYGSASAINNAGQVCGDDGFTAFIYDPDDGFWLLDDLLYDNQADLDKWFAGFSQKEARGMAQLDDGDYPMIVGVQFGDTTRAFLLTPIIPTP